MARLVGKAKTASETGVSERTECCGREGLRVEFLLKTDTGYPKDTGLNKPWQPLGILSAITPIGQLHQSPPSPIPGDLGRGPSHQSTCSNIETRMDRPKSVVVRVIRGVA